MTVKEKMQVQEVKDYEITKRVLGQLLSKSIESGESTDIYFYKTTDYVSYDMGIEMNYSGEPFKVAVEIKERNKTIEQATKYPGSEITLRKLGCIWSSTGNFNQVLYVSLVNDFIAYIWDLREYDWSKAKEFDWNIKKTQLNHKSKVITEKAYLLPWDTADWSIRI